MKTIIVFLLIFISFADGNQLAWEFSADSFSNETNTTQSTPSVTNSTASTTTTVLTTTTLSPTATVGINVTWIFYSGVNVTYVEMTITNLQAKEWAAIGFGEQTTMKNAHVFMCKRPPNNQIKMDRYVINVPYDIPDAAGSAQGGDVTLGEQTFVDGVVTCRFNLSNFATESVTHLGNPQKLSQSGNYYPLFAVGALDDSNEPQEHAKDSRAVFNDTVQLNTQNTVLYKVNNGTTNATTTTTTTTTTAVPTTTTLSPTATVGINVTWIFYSGVNVTYVEMTITNLQAKEWAAIGFGELKTMKNAHVFMCKRPSNNQIKMDRYVINVPYDTPDTAGPAQGGDVTLGEQTFVDGVVTCRFNLSNFATQSMTHLGNPQKLSQSGNYYPLFAVGALDDNNGPEKHADDSCAVFEDTVQLDKEDTVLYHVNNGTTNMTTTTAVSTTTTLSPTAAVGINVTWIFYSGISVTYVEMTVTNLGSKQWAAIGLGEQTAMKNAHVFMCKRSPKDEIKMDRYVINVPYDTPDAAGPAQGGFVTLGPQTFANGVVTCRFNLSNFTTQSMTHLGNPQKLSQSGNYYPLFAVGPLDDSNEPQKHPKDSCIALTDTVQLNTQKTILYKVNNTSGGDSSSKYFQAHGIIMVFAWMFFASTGILLSRYFKTSWIDSLVCGEKAWFSGHRFIMSIVTILTIIAFLFILVALEGAWVGSDEEIKHYVHSITGAMVISFAFFQPFIALFRCKPDSRYRFIYNYVHAFFGYSALALSIVTIFLASYFKLFKNSGGRVVMTLWTIWIVVIFILFQLVKIYFRKKNQRMVYGDINASNKLDTDDGDSATSDENSGEKKVKNILLALHVLMAAILSIVMSVLIG